MRPKPVIWLLITAIAIMAQVAYASSSNRPELVTDGSITIVGDVEAGAEFDIIFKFTLLPKGAMYEVMQEQKKMMSDRAKDGDTLAMESLHGLAKRPDIAMIEANENIEFLSQTIWVGKLEPNMENTLIVKAQLKEKKETTIRGIIGYSCDELAETAEDICVGRNIFWIAVLPGVNIPQPPEEKWDTITTRAGGTVRIKKTGGLSPPINGISPEIKKSKTPKELNDLKNKATENDSVKENNPIQEDSSESTSGGQTSDTYLVTGTFYYVTLMSGMQCTFWIMYLILAHYQLFARNMICNITVCTYLQDYCLVTGKQT
ncbi:MAG: hypothetical protein GY841_17025 [FCB group bacterium]|nr:hypothetical protein [FCB group bacterium]